MKNFSMFDFKADLHIGDEKLEVLEGSVQVSPIVLMQDDFFREHQDYGFDFFGAYNLRTKDVNVVATYYPDDGEGFGEVVNLPLTEDEKLELIDSMEAFCEKRYKVNCLQMVNWQRESVGLERLEVGMSAFSKEQIMEEIGYRMEEIYGIPLTEAVKSELVRFVQNNTYLLYADRDCFDDVVGQKHKEIMKEQFGDFSGVVGHLSELLSKRDGWDPESIAEQLDVVFESEHYVGVYYDNGENEYYLVDKENGAYDLVLGDSPDFVGRYYLDKMGIENDIRVVNEKALGSLVEYSRENIADSLDFWTDERIKGLLVLEKAISEVRQEKKEEIDMFSLDDKILSAQDAVGAAEQEKMEKATVSLWARLGVSIDVTPEELASLQNGGRDARELLVSLIQSDRCRLDGETYFPLDANDGLIKDELEFDLNPVQLQSRSNRNKER